MIAVLENRNSATPGVLAGNLDAILNGLGTGVDQDGLLGVVAGGVLGKQFTDPDILFVRSAREQRVRHARELLLRGRDNGVVRVANGHHADSATKVEEVVAIDIDNDCAVRAFDVDAERGANTAGHNGRSPRAKFF